MPVSNETQNSEELTEQDWLEILAPLSDEDAVLLDAAMSRPLDSSSVALGKAQRKADLARMGVSLDDDIETAAERYLLNRDDESKRAILAEAKCLRARLSSIPWYKDSETSFGQFAWIRMAIDNMED